MQTELQKLIVLRDQFALKNLSDETLKLILPAYREAFRNLEFKLKNMPPEGASIERELWLRSQMATIQAQFAAVAKQIDRVLPPAQLEAWEGGTQNAQSYVEAGGINPKFNITAGGGEQEFLSPSITRQQVIAAARKTGFEELSPGGSKVGLEDLLPDWQKAQTNLVARSLRAGFLTGASNEEIERQIGPLGPGRQGWSMTQSLVRTSMAEASQSAHDSFYEANAELLPPTEEGYRWWWDASNDTRLCKICAPLDGVKFKERQNPPKPWPAHWSCRCKLLPITATMEELERTEGPASGSFLEATPVKKDRNGKRLPRPSGYDGDNAYKNPMKIDGEYQWVRRRDLGPGETTAGFMLKNANENSKKIILGSDDLVKSWNKQIKTEQYSKDPQALVRKLLGEPLGPNYQLPQYPGGPKPKPPAPKPAPKPPAPEPPAAKPPAPEAQSTEAFIFLKQAMPAKAKLTPRDVSDGLQEFAQLEGLRGENMKKMLQFQRQNNIAAIWTNGNEKNATDLSHVFTNEVKSSLDSAISRNVGRGVGVTKEIRTEIESGNLGAYTNGYMKVKRGNDGHTAPGLGVIVIRHSSHDKPVGSSNGVNRYFNAVHQGILDALALKPGHSVAQPMYYSASGKAGSKMIAVQGWLNAYVHEMGHQVHFAAGTPVKPFQGKDVVPWLASKYAGTNGLESFAETFVQYVIDPEGLKSANQSAYKWIDDAITKALGAKP